MPDNCKGAVCDVEKTEKGVELCPYHHVMQSLTLCDLKNPKKCKGPCPYRHIMGEVVICIVEDVTCTSSYKLTNQQ